MYGVAGGRSAPGGSPGTPGSTRAVDDSEAADTAAKAQADALELYMSLTPAAKAAHTRRWGKPAGVPSPKSKKKAKAGSRT
jgi:hypothetical protein